MSEGSLHTSDGGMTLDALVKHVKRKRKNGLLSDFISIGVEPADAKYEEGEKEENLYYKNRYYNVVAMDHSRVKLKSGTYINANFADGYKQKNAFIAAQGPLTETFTDFWEMVWEQSVMTIAMATRLTDGGRYSLCGEYWPSTPGQSRQYGNLIVTNSNVKKGGDYTVTSLMLQDRRTGDSREVTHIHFTKWPDYGVPSSAEAFLAFISQIRRSQLEAMERISGEWTGDPLGPPIVVHCSAGIGRTGTVCTVDICLQQLADTGTLDIPGTLKRLRSQRSWCIQTQDQYLFTYKSILQHAREEGFIQNDDLKADVERLCENLM